MHEIKRKSGVGKVLLTTVLSLVASVVATVVTRIDDAGLPIPGLMLLALGAFYILWIVYLVRRRKEYALVLQTNAGDSPRLLTSQDEQSLDNLISAGFIRLEPGNNLPPLIATINDNSIKMGDVTMGDQIIISENSGIIDQIASHTSAGEMSFSQTWGQIQRDMDLSALAAELKKLHQEIQNKAVAPEQVIALNNARNAEDVALSGDAPKVLEHLRSSGTRVLGVVKVSVPS
jgi:hypothetical protein